MKKLIALLFGLFLVAPVFAGGSHHGGGGSTPPPTTTPPPAVSTYSADQGDDYHDTQRAVRGVLITAALICAGEWVYVGLADGKWKRMCFTGYGSAPAQVKDENPDSIVPVTANPKLYGVEVKEKK